jgi:hypothetical protein
MLEEDEELEEERPGAGMRMKCPAPSSLGARHHFATQGSLLRARWALSPLQVEQQRSVHSFGTVGLAMGGVLTASSCSLQMQISRLHPLLKRNLI